MEKTSKFPEVSVVRRIMPPTPNSRSCPCSKMPAIDMVKCRLRKGRVSWILPVVHVTIDLSHEAGRAESEKDWRMPCWRMPYCVLGSPSMGL